MSRSAVLFAAFLTACLSAGPAAAHALLLESVPKSGAVVAGGPVDFVLRYNSRVDSARSRLLLKDGRGGSQRLTIQPGADEASLKAQGLTLAPGKYNLHWEVLSVDGHISRGDLGFSVSGP